MRWRVRWYHPKVIVLDEPFSGLDPLVRDELIESLLERATETTIFVSSHDLAEVESFASHVGYLEQGQLQFSEELVALAACFREVDVTLDAPPENHPEIRIPLVVSGIAEGFIVSIDGATLTIESPNGSRWNSGWKSTSLRLFPTSLRTQMDFEVNRDFFEKIKSSDVGARIALALTVFHVKDAKRVIATEGEFALPGVGLCSIEPGYITNSLQCRYPFQM